MREEELRCIGARLDRLEFVRISDHLTNMNIVIMPQQLHTAFKTTTANPQLFGLRLLATFLINSRGTTSIPCIIKGVPKVVVILNCL